MTDRRLTGDELVAVLAALASPLRLRIVARLADGREYVSQLARDVGISRPLLHMHLQKLEAAGLVSFAHELSAEGKAMKYVEVVPFDIALTPDAVGVAVAGLPPPET